VVGADVASVSAWYNENDEYAAHWLRNLIAARLIAPGVVDDRSIELVQPEDLNGFTQCHFFAGIGGWSLAARLAGWDDDRPLWSASCPCQPFSVIGLGLGESDPRHHWPKLSWLIEKRRPADIVGEQVASADGRVWFSRVRADLETMGYAAGGGDLCAAGVSAPHIRQRLYWVGHTDDAGLEGHSGHGDAVRRSSAARSVPAASCAVPWDASVRITDRLGFTRRSEPGTSPMARRVPTHMGRLRAYGNVIVPQLAAEFMMAYMECRP